MAVAIVWLLSIFKWNLLSLFESVNNFIEFKEKRKKSYENDKNWLCKLISFYSKNEKCQLNMCFLYHFGNR